jgi:hypothetical protein
MRRLAATYLALDRFVLTDRIADFVRRFTIRASNADFSVSDVDLVLRRFEVYGTPLSPGLKPWAESSCPFGAIYSHHTSNTRWY